MAKILTLSLFALLLLACGDKGSKPSTDRANVGITASVGTTTLRLGSLNMTVGWRAEDLILKQLNDSQVVYSALHNLHSQYLASHPVQRLGVMARTFLYAPVDVLALQEVQVMRSGDSVQTDFLVAFLDSLRAQGDTTNWKIHRQDLNRISLDVLDTLGNRMDIEFWEGNAFLVHPSLTVVDSQEQVFRDLVYFGILEERIPSQRGAQSIRLELAPGLQVQLWNTHLEVEVMSIVNRVQGVELNGMVWEEWQDPTLQAQVLVGDLNSRVGKGGAGALANEGSGLTDLWLGSTHANQAIGSDLLYPWSNDSGWTCCVSSVEQLESGFNRRIDYMLGRGIAGVDTMRVVPVKDNVLWGADHGYLRAVLRL